MRPLVANYYLTFKCNDTCEFCPVWLDNDLPIEESPADVICKNLKDLKSLGIVYVDFTGGEPLLYNQLPQVLDYAKKLKLFTTITTNGILYEQRASQIKGKVDRLIFSLDSPFKNEHNRIRGEDIFDRLLDSVRLAKAIGENPIINFTVTRNSVNYLPETMELCESLGVFLWLNPVNDFFGTQGYASDTIDYLKYYDKRKKVALNQAMLKLISKGGNSQLWPKCKATQSTITIFSDNTYVLPCYHNRRYRIEINGKLKELFRHSKEKKQAMLVQGRSEMCHNCMSSNYMIPSFLYQIDSYFFLNLNSLRKLFIKEYNYRKENKK